jgi:hypothetical protein
MYSVFLKAFSVSVGFPDLNKSIVIFLEIKNNSFQWSDDKKYFSATLIFLNVFIANIGLQQDARVKKYSLQKY